MAEYKDPTPKEYYNKTKQNEQLNPQWWQEDDDQMFQSIFMVVKTIEARQKYREINYIRNARAYSNHEFFPLQPWLINPGAQYRTRPHNIQLNLIKSGADTIVNKIAKAKPRPLFLTEGGDWKLRKQAEGLTKYMDGTFERQRIYEKGPRAALDSTVFGLGNLKMFIDWEKECTQSERVMPGSLIVDDFEGIAGTPKNLHESRHVGKESLINMFPKFEEQIMAAGSGLASGYSSKETRGLVRVLESWHLPSSKKAKDGRKVISIDTATLDVSPWTREYFPFPGLYWNYRLSGFYGQGIPDEAAGIQEEIDRLLFVIQKAQHRIAVPRIIVGSNTNTAHINAEIASFIKLGVGDAPPQFITPAAVNPELYQHLERLIKLFYELIGVSQLSAQSLKPAGLNSQVALREYQDIESERFQLFGQRYEQFFMDAARMEVDNQRELAEKVPGLKVMVNAGGKVEQIKWKDVNLEDSQYILRVFPTSILPTTPAGKLQKVTELAQAGWIDKDTGNDLLDFPDLEAANKFTLAPRKIILRLLGNMLEKGEYMTPEPYMNLQMSIDLTQQFYLDSMLEGVPEDRLELLRRFMEDCDTQIKMAEQKKMLMQAQAQAAAQPPGAGPQGGAPQAAPTAPPQSVLLPNAPGGAA